MEHYAADLDHELSNEILIRVSETMMEVYSVVYAISGKIESDSIWSATLGDIRCVHLITKKHVYSQVQKEKNDWRHTHECDVIW